MKKNGSGSATKKPLYKKWWFWIIAVVLIAGACRALVGPDASAQQTAETTAVPTNTVAPVVAATAEPEITPEPDEAAGAIKSGSYTLPSGMEVYFHDSVRNDVTGKWRLSTTSDSMAPADYAVEYYNTLFSSDDEVHAVWNATLGTMTSITAGEGLVFASTYEYVDGEEHDAKLMFTGLLLDERIYNISTGELWEADD